MFNAKKPALILALMSVPMATMYWLVFYTCFEISKKVGPGNLFNRSIGFYVIIGIAIPIVGIFGGTINMIKNKETESNPVLLFISVIFLFSTIFFDAYMIRDVFTGGSIAAHSSDD